MWKTGLVWDSHPRTRFRVWEREMEGDTLVFITYEKTKGTMGYITGCDSPYWVYPAAPIIKVIITVVGLPPRLVGRNERESTGMNMCGYVNKYPIHNISSSADGQGGSTHKKGANIIWCVCDGYSSTNEF